jgi:hypothetical protein
MSVSFMVVVYSSESVHELEGPKQRECSTGCGRAVQQRRHVCAERLQLHEKDAGI